MKSEKNIIVVILTTAPADVAGEIARVLVDERLAACVSVGEPVHSIYRWQGAVEEASESPMVIKTTAAKVEAARVRVSSLHPYELPEWLVIEAAGAAAYLEWIRTSIDEGGGAGTR